MKRVIVLWIVGGLLLFAGCREKQLDMTLVQATAYQEYAIHAISASDIWNITIVQDDGPSFIELEYSAFMEEYMHIQYEQDSFVFYIGLHPHLPNNTVLNATIHTDYLRSLSLRDASFATIEGDFHSPSLWMELDDAATCKGGRFFGDAELKLSDASQWVECSLEGSVCRLELNDASVFKGCLYINDNLTMTIDDASHFTDYWGEIHRADVKVSDASYLNMATSWIDRMYIEVTDASEATVNVVESLEGLVHDASTLNYSGDPILNLDCDESSTFKHVDYPNPD